eukprot:755410-Hanusia_phi.AAC.1
MLPYHANPLPSDPAAPQKTGGAQRLAQCIRPGGGDALRPTSRAQRPLLPPVLTESNQHPIQAYRT